MTSIFFVRHALSDRTVKEGRIRPLTQEGWKDAQRLIPLFRDIVIDGIYSSPYRRAIDTVHPLAEDRHLDIVTDEDFRERKSDSKQTLGREELTRIQWKDFSYTLSDGECFQEVQERNIAALRRVLTQAQNQSVVIGTHGVALCTILHYYEPLSDTECEDILLRMPYVVKLRFEGERYLGREEVPFE